MRSESLIILKTPLALLLWHLLIFPAAARTAADGAEPTGPVHIRTSVDRTEITIGDYIRYTITITAEPRVDVAGPVLHDRLGDFDIIDFGQESVQPQAERTQWYTLTIFTTGYHIIPAPSVRYTMPDGTQHETSGEALRIHVASLLTQEGQPTDIRDIKPPEDIPFQWRPFLLGGTLLVAMIGMGLALYYGLKRLRRATPPPPRTAHAVALDALSQLRARQLPQAGQFEAYYVALSAIVRTYLEDGLNMRAPEMTTEEFLSAVTSDTRLSRLTPAQQRLLGAFLSQADLVKFARHIPSLDESDAAHEAARRFVDETRQPYTLSAGEERSAEEDRPQEDRYAAA